ncbi:DndE family protein, partial [Erwinia amylovora]
MLPNRLQLSRQTEEQLKKLKGYTVITPNVAARLAFFR